MTIGFDLPAPQRARVEIFDPTGRRVRTLAGIQEFGTGEHALLWEGHDDGGAPVPGGIYLVRVQVGRDAAVKKVTVMR